MRIVVRKDFLSQFHKVLTGMPEIQNDFRTGKPLAEHLFQSRAPVGQGNLLLGLIETRRRGLPS